MPVAYEISMPRPDTHLFHVRMEVRGSGTRGRDLVMAVWTPGSYVLREYSKHVQNFQAFPLERRRKPGRPRKRPQLRWRKTAKNRWRVETESDYHVEYDVYANEFTVQGAHLDDTHGYYNGACVFMHVDGRKEEECEVRIHASKGWEVATTLEQIGRSGLFRAKDFDELLDSPVECGRHRIVRFTVKGVEHRLVLYGRGNIEEDRLLRDLRRIVEAAHAMFGAFPYKSYTFFLHITDRSAGGLEHLSSTVCQVSRFAFRPRKDYDKILTLFAHEYFHAWNVKAIHSEVLGPFDYERENYTRLLWWHEGITSYYDFLLPKWGGCYDAKRFNEMIAEEWKRYLGTPARATDSLEASSFDSWVRFYRQDENSPNSTMSYYIKGEIVGLILDLEIRSRTGGKKSLDDVFREMNAQYALRGRGIPEDAIQRLCERVAGSSMQRFFDDYVRGTAEINLDRWLRKVGLRIGAEKKKDEEKEEKLGGYIGLVTKTENGRLFVRHVYSDGPAYSAGVYAEDEIVALDWFRVDASTFKERLDRMAPGDWLTMSVFRRGELKSLRVRLSRRPPEKYVVEPLRRASRQQRSLFEGWMREPWKPGGEKERRNGKKEAKKPESAARARGRKRRGRSRKPTTLRRARAPWRRRGSKGRRR
jgi:predicted metalloprotease with PDZ domain